MKKYITKKDLEERLEDRNRNIIISIFCILAVGLIAIIIFFSGRSSSCESIAKEVYKKGVYLICTPTGEIYE